jgi:hypothetical protein
MTTEVRNYYHPAAYPQDLGVITAKPFERPDGSTCAIIDLASDLDHPRAGSLWIDDRARARELLTAAFEALRILDPDGAAEALDALIEAEPGLVIPPADDACPQTAEGCTDESCTEHAPRTAVLSCGHNHSVPDDAQPGDLVFCVHCAVRRAIRAEPKAAEADLAPCAADDEPWCGANTRTEDGPFGCTAVAGHEGSHVAHGPQDQVCHTWPQEPAPFTSPDLVIQPARVLTDEEHANLPEGCACNYFLRTDDGLWELSSRKTCRLHDVPAKASTL